MLQLVILLDKSLVELRQFGLHVVLDILLLVPNDLEDFVFKLLFALFDLLF